MMASLINFYISLIAFLIFKQSTAHFLLHYPPTIGFDDDLENEAPCGSFTVDFSTDNVTNYHVGGDTLALVPSPLFSHIYKSLAYLGHRLQSILKPPGSSAQRLTSPLQETGPICFQPSNKPVWAISANRASRFRLHGRDPRA